MRIIYTTDTSREGNDCWINETITLVRVCGFYAVFRSDNTTGWWENKSIDTLIITEEYEEALSCYHNNGGVIWDEDLD